MEIVPKPLYKFDDFTVNVCERQLSRRGETIALPPKVFDTLIVLVENPGRLLEKEFLMTRIWPESFVEESSLTQYVFQLRKALGEDGNGVRYIETVPKRGYRFLAQVEESLPAPIIESVTSYLPQMPTIVAPGRYQNGEATLPSFAFQSATDVSTTIAVPRLRFKFKQSLIAFTLLIFSVAVVYFAVSWLGRKTATARPVQIAKLTTNGKSVTPALSPDGKYIAYVQEDTGKQSIWVRQTSTTGNVQVVAPAEVDYQGLSFAPDGNFIYYVSYQLPKHLASLYRIPVLGGTPTKILDDIDSAVTFAPDGKQFAFVRNNLEQMNNALIIANMEGKHEHILTTRKIPYAFALDGPSWSPDGKLIALAQKSIEAGKPFMSVVGIQVADGKEVSLSAKKWTRIGQVAWRKDGNGLIAVARPSDTAILANQIWYFPFPADEPRRITNDLANYTSISLAAQADKLVASQSTKASHFWIVPQDEAGQAQQLSSVGIDNFSENMGLSWLTNEQLIYGSFNNGNTDLWSMSLDGSRQKQLTVEKSDDLQPAVSFDGRYVAFLSDRAGSFNVWRMNADGSNVVQITRGEGENSPSFSPDGKWIVYSGMRDGMFVLWKVPIEGGTPVQLTNETSIRPTISPDGKSVAHLRLDQTTYRMKLSVVPMEGGDKARMLEATIPDPHIINWSPDGKMLTYIDTRDGISNVWGQPVDGSNPHPITNFKNDQIFRFAWSKDGKALALERGFYLNDVVLISDFS